MIFQNEVVCQNMVPFSPRNLDNYASHHPWQIINKCIVLTSLTITPIENMISYHKMDILFYEIANHHQDFTFQKQRCQMHLLLESSRSPSNFQFSQTCKHL
jgi:hypothetical protein